MKKDGDEGKDAKEALGAYNQVQLRISGNSTTLAKWDARLGPLLHSLSPATSKRRVIPPIVSLAKLTPDGGLVSLVDVVIERMYPVGYTETLPDQTKLETVNAKENRMAEAKVEVSALCRTYYVIVAYELTTWTFV